MGFWDMESKPWGYNLSTKEKLKMELRGLSYMLKNWEERVFDDETHMINVLETYDCLEEEYKKIRSLYEQYIKENS